MSVSNPFKTVTPDSIGCSGTATVTIGFEAAASLSASPAEIILIMDRSGSMSSPRLEYAKAAADHLIDIVTAASGGQSSISNGSRLGLVSFSDLASVDSPLTDDTSALHNAIADLTYGGFTNHTAAFEAAEQLLPPPGTARQIVVLFTDGISTIGGDAAPVAARLKAAGAEVYCIGLGQNTTQLDVWASAPVAAHVTSDADPAQLDRLFREIASEVVLAGALDAVIHEELNPDFKIIRVGTPTDGSVQVTGPQSLVWSMDAAGLAAQPKPVSLNFEIMYIGTGGGVRDINRLLTYEDRAGNALVFPAPSIDVVCSGPVVYPEPCPIPTTFHLDSCQDSTRVSLEDTGLHSLGRIVQVDATVRNVCPGKPVAVAIILTEEASDGVEHNRGFKTITLPAQTGSQCQDITLQCVSFVVPDGSGSLCEPRTFRARVIANYTDTDYICCDAASVNI